MLRRRWGLSWRLNGRPEEPPVVYAGRRDNGMRLLALEEGAETAGLKCGQGLAEARAICPNLIVIEEDPAADRRFLEALGDWCDRYTPLVGLDGADGLFLDITGCAHLFGGEEAMLKDILTRLTQMGMAVQGQSPARQAYHQPLPASTQTALWETAKQKPYLLPCR